MSVRDRIARAVMGGGPGLPFRGERAWSIPPGPEQIRPPLAAPLGEGWGFAVGEGEAARVFPTREGAQKYYDELLRGE